MEDDTMSLNRRKLVNVNLQDVLNDDVIGVKEFPSERDPRMANKRGLHSGPFCHQANDSHKSLRSIHTRRNRARPFVCSRKYYASSLISSTNGRTLRRTGIVITVTSRIYETSAWNTTLSNVLLIDDFANVKGFYKIGISEEALSSQYE